MTSLNPSKPYTLKTSFRRPNLGDLYVQVLACPNADSTSDFQLIFHCGKSPLGSSDESLVFEYSFEGV